jgi:hypothetical protein
MVAATGTVEVEDASRDYGLFEHRRRRFVNSLPGFFGQGRRISSYPFHRRFTPFAPLFV